jgi:hypothetical protein
MIYRINCSLPNRYAYISIFFILSGSFIILFNRACPELISDYKQFTILFPVGLGVIFIGLYYFIRFDLYRRRNRNNIQNMDIDNNTSYQSIENNV